MKKYYLIKDLATLSGLSTDTIRFYEKRKLLSIQAFVVIIIIAIMMKIHSNELFLLNVVDP